MSKFRICQGDCLSWMQTYPENYFDLVLGSPPYEDARKDALSLRGQDWVDWLVTRFKEMLRVCKGLVAMVVEGRTDKFRWSATPALLMADLHRAGIKLRKPPIYHRSGIFGGGGPDWLRNDYELVVCASKGRLPWSDNTAMGHTPKYPPGGDPSHRNAKGDRVAKKKYKPPARANPGNVIHCKVGKGHMGDDLAHFNSAPFPETLAEFFVKSFCPPGGLVLDPFCGSGTTGAVCVVNGRDFLGLDLREEQCDLATRRIHKRLTEKA